MSDRVNAVQLHNLLEFLQWCELAATPPPAKRNALMGLLDSPSLMSSGAFAAKLAAVPRSAEVSAFLAGFVGDEPMAPSRPERINQLNRAMRYFPAFDWLSRQPAIRNAKESFDRVAKRKGASEKLTDDCAHFRFWQCAVWAAICMDMKSISSPTATIRRNSATAARRLLAMNRTSTLLIDAGLTWQQRDAFVHALERVVAFEGSGRGERNDAHRADREYVELLTESIWARFGCAPPSVVIAFAALKVANPDQVAITKRVKAFATALAMRDHG